MFKEIKAFMSLSKKYNINLATSQLFMNNIHDELKKVHVYMKDEIIVIDK